MDFKIYILWNSLSTETNNSVTLLEVFSNKKYYYTCNINDFIRHSYSWSNIAQHTSDITLDGTLLDNKFSGRFLFQTNDKEEFVNYIKDYNIINNI